MQFSKRLGKVRNVDILECDNLQAAKVVNLKNKVNRLMNKKHFKIIVDLKSAKKMDVAGIGILVEKLIRMREKKGDIKLCQLRPEVSRVMDRMGVASLFETFTSREDALKSFKRF